MATKKKASTKKGTAKKSARAVGSAPSPSVRTSGAVTADVSAFDALELEDFGGSSFSWEDRQLLGRVSRFLTAVLSPRLLRRAVGAGYSREEHDGLWSLFVKAAGRDQSLAFAFASLDGAEAGDKNQLLGELDAFENEWFPKTRAIIERFVPEEQADRFAKAFFKDLQQQPLGPLVIDSVSTFLDRVEALATTEEAGAADVLRNLRTRGLSERRVSEIRELLDLARSGTPTSPAKVDAAAWKNAQQAQTQALRSLRLAWNDWSTTLRSVYDVREQLQLGLTEVKVRAEASAPEKPAEKAEKAPT